VRLAGRAETVFPAAKAKLLAIECGQDTVENDSSTNTTVSQSAPKPTIPLKIERRNQEAMMVCSIAA